MNKISDRAQRQLHALARSKGVEVRWRAQDGSRQTCSDETLLAILQMLRVDVARPDDAARARADLYREHRDLLIDPVTVAWDGAMPRVSIRLPGADAEADFAIVVTTESNDELRWTRRDLSAQTSATTDRHGNIDLVVGLPRGFDPGRHDLRLTVGNREARSTLIAAPTRIASGTTRAWGVFAPVYALHTRADSGMGDLRALDRLGQWIAGRGGTVIGTLPILAMFVGHGKEPCDPSPYAPVSRRFWNELYLDLRALPELSGASDLPTPASARSLDLPGLAASRRPFLEAAATRIDESPVRRRELEQWLTTRPEATAYAEFRAALEGTGRGGVAVHEYAQWSMASQLTALASSLAGRGQSLYIDLPVGTHREGYDVATRPELFARSGSVGAPPDDFQPTGQDWGFPPLDPDAARADGHAYLAACLDEQLQYARHLRLDHVMGLHRLWMIPAGAPGSDGAYVHYPAEEHWATICLATARHHATIVGENLGTVPLATDRAMRRHRALGMWVVEFELPDEAGAAEARVDAPGAGVLACIDTHDLPTFAGWWAALEQGPRRALLATLRASGDLDAGDAEPAAVLGAVLAWMGRSRAPLVIASLEDLWLEPMPQNIPGAGHEAETFRQRAAHGIEEFDSLPTVRRALDRLALARRSAS